MKDIQVGDHVFDEHGRPTRVLFVSDEQLNRKCFEVQFSTGETIIADAEHLWTFAVDTSMEGPQRSQHSLWPTRTRSTM